MTDDYERRMNAWRRSVPRQQYERLTSLIDDIEERQEYLDSISPEARDYISELRETISGQNNIITAAMSAYNTLESIYNAIDEVEESLMAQRFMELESLRVPSSPFYFNTMDIDYVPELDDEQEDEEEDDEQEDEEEDDEQDDEDEEEQVVPNEEVGGAFGELLRHSKYPHLYI